MRGLTSRLGIGEEGRDAPTGWPNTEDSSWDRQVAGGGVTIELRGCVVPKGP